MGGNIDRLDEYIATDRLLRGRWGSVAEGRACLLVALAGDEVIENAAACPADVLPAWLAIFTPWIDDSGSLAEHAAKIRRYARLVRASAGLSPEAWRRLDYRVRAVIVRAARTHTTDPATLAAIDGVLALLDRAAEGGVILGAEWSSAQSAAKTAAWAAEAAQSAKTAKASKAAAWAAAGAAAGAAAWAAAAAARSAAAWSATETAEDRMIAGILDAWEWAAAEAAARSAAGTAL